MAEVIMLEVVTPERRVVHEEVTELTAPGLLGEFGVLMGHEPFVTVLRPGLLYYRCAQGGEERTLAVGQGFAEIVEDRVTLLVEACEGGSEIDRARAGKARDEATQRMKALPLDSEEIGELQAALDRAEARLAASDRTAN
ncbi:MAG: F0F1 ATP synthase subunit epsilon [Deltaproteobacteria bacterium]|nr:F0F1 ATP synthase subunit epsilon [Deltaproteobacteria bacterium]